MSHGVAMSLLGMQSFVTHSFWHQKRWTVPNCNWSKFLEWSFFTLLFCHVQFGHWCNWRVNDLFEKHLGSACLRWVQVPVFRATCPEWLFQTKTECHVKFFVVGCFVMLLAPLQRWAWVSKLLPAQPCPPLCHLPCLQHQPPLSSLLLTTFCHCHPQPHKKLQRRKGLSHREPWLWAGWQRILVCLTVLPLHGESSSDLPWRHSFLPQLLGHVAEWHREQSVKWPLLLTEGAFGLN